MVNVELVFLSAAKDTVHHRLELKAGSTVSEALDQSGIYLSHPETKELPVGIYSKQVSLDTVLKEGDRVEFYRPLSLDPKEIRRKKASAKKKSK